MMGYLDRLKAANSEQCPPLPLSKPPKAPYGSFDTRDGARFQKITPLVRPADDAATASCWWLIHYPDRDSAEVASYPLATHAEILERHPEAIAAEPIHQVALEPAQTSCNTCTHVTGRGGCGVPVAAGLSNLPGVIRYRPDQGATCPVWLVAIPVDLEHLIRRAGTYWEYSPEDYDLVRYVARRDPDGLRLSLESDPLQPFYHHKEIK
jgi:hypothetical protein